MQIVPDVFNICTCLYVAFRIKFPANNARLQACNETGDHQLRVKVSVFCHIALQIKTVPNNEGIKQPSRQFVYVQFSILLR